MMGITHALIGATIGLALHSSAAPLDQAAASALCAVAALLPDVDHPQSMIRSRIGIAGDLAFGWFGHRGITHSTAAVALVALVAFALLPHSVALIMVAGYSSHLIADAVTRGGVPLFAPLSRKRYGLPLIVTGGLLEDLLALALTLFLMATILAQMLPKIATGLCALGVCL